MCVARDEEAPGLRPPPVSVASSLRTTVVGEGAHPRVRC